MHENSFYECSDDNVPQKFREDQFLSLHDNSILDSGNVSSNLVILAKNGRIGFEEKIGEALSELSSIYWDIVIFTEARCETDNYHLEGDHLLLASGFRNEASGVAILVHKRDVHSKIKYEKCNSRIMSVEINFHGQAFLCIACYLPPAGYAEEEFKENYDLLDNLISRARKKSKQIICGGDFQTEFDPSLHRGMLLMH